MAAAIPLVGALAGGSLLGKGIKSIIGGGGSKSSTPTPTPAPAPVMPSADSEAVARARKKTIALQLARGGRSGTILSSTSDRTGTTLGG